MAEYETKTIPLSHLIIGSLGPINPLCNSCKTGDCTNPIRLNKVSVFGIEKEYYLFMKRNEPCAVVECKGYQPNEK